MSESETTCHDCGGTQDDVDDGVGPLNACDLCDERRMVCLDCGHRLDERGEPEGSGGIVACGECYSRLNRETTPDEVIVLRADNARLRSVLAALIAALPKCTMNYGDGSGCERPATRAFLRGAERYCDVHGTDSPNVSKHAPEHPRAAPLRAAIALLSNETRSYKHGKRV